MAVKMQDQQIMHFLCSCSGNSCMIYGGDEFCNSQNGNNNAYSVRTICWMDRLESFERTKYFQFVKEVCLSEAHPILHMEKEPKRKEPDYLAKVSDISFP